MKASEVQDHLHHKIMLTAFHQFWGGGLADLF